MEKKLRVFRSKKSATTLLLYAALLITGAVLIIAKADPSTRLDRWGFDGQPIEIAWSVTFRTIAFFGIFFFGQIIPGLFNDLFRGSPLLVILDQGIFFRHRMKKGHEVIPWTSIDAAKIERVDVNLGVIKEGANVLSLALQQPSKYIWRWKPIGNEMKISLKGVSVDPHVLLGAIEQRIFRENSKVA